ncbi:MAG TPA: exodeoxyribonuclease VII small subunit [Bacteroidales bacterium]|nr:exodeoxyribonuclease VII small subunit [Bacteroidales bacterium]
MKEELNYLTSFEELQEIIKKIETSEINVDELTPMLERASLLIKVCKDILTKTEAEVNKLIENI